MRPEVCGRIAERASSQLGLITIEQLATAGASRQERRTMTTSGAWRRVGRRVLADSAAPVTTRQAIIAAVLDTGRPEAVATASTAAWLLGLSTFAPAPPHVLVKRGGNPRARLGVLHETFWLPAHHRQVVDGVPVVSTARLPFELAWQLHPERLRRLVDRLMTARGLTVDALALTVAELCRSGRPGSAEMRLVVDERAPGYVPPASALEHAYLRFCDAFALPQGERQVDVGGARWIGRVDVLYRAQRVVVELDGRRWHVAATRFEDDRHRDNALTAAGWRVIRITWRMLHDEPERVAALLRPLLAAVAA